MVSFKTKLENLPLILTMGRFKRRPNINGKSIKTRERILGHRIIPFNPKLVQANTSIIFNETEGRYEMNFQY